MKLKDIITIIASSILVKYLINGIKVGFSFPLTRQLWQSNTNTIFKIIVIFFFTLEIIKVL